MKKLTFILLCLLSSTLSNAQLSLTKDDNTPITNGQIFTFNTTDESVATLKYKIKNISTSAINVRIKIMSIQNGTGSGFQFCYLTTCIPSVSVNAVYPSNSNAAIPIAANSETPALGYNMWNTNIGNGTTPISYVIKFYQVDGSNQETGIPITITYKYDPTALAVNETSDKFSFANVTSTLIIDNINIVTSENIAYKLYSMDGSVLLNGTMNKGKKSIDISSQNSGVYILTMKNSQGEMKSEKLIKK
ncbi:hypothetical protein BA768_02900 [Chryseobacterium sp. CBo1]|uniref:T9SS type A sorting domain-containing protein n=1 Tax=Chryseobacterium sp. CBo1 TaxID=1869230 RepID=UPI000810ADDF|nr:T9SS type A sorting domain-containing protein [Chryseobacterium sp. CBo1]OCK51679.1 hypothetical protein BA768_02900 [Chryseobacterium sp. CBo1]